MANNRVIAAAIIVILAIVAVAYWYTSTPAEQPAFNVLVAYDVNSRGDKSFNDMAYFGAAQAQVEFGVNVAEITPLSLAEMEDVLRTVTQSEEYDIILCVGFLWSDALNTVAQEFPDQKYGAIDIQLPERSNVLSVSFYEEEGCVLVGALAALVTNSSTVGNVLGMEIPLLWKFEIGYKFGVQYIENMTGRDIEVLWDYTGEFGRPDLGRESTITMLDAGADVIFQAAGETGLGVIDAVAERGSASELPFAIGVDANQDWVQPGRVIASMRKLVNIGTYTAIKQAYEDNFQGGTVIYLGMEEGGISISDLTDLDVWLADPILKLIIEEDTGLTTQEVRTLVANMRDAWANVTIDGTDYAVWDLIMDIQQDIIEGDIIVPVATADTIAELRTRYD
jgi:basic membrane protein A